MNIGIFCDSMCKKCKYCGTTNNLFKGKNWGKLITYNLCKSCKSKMAREQSKHLHTPEIIKKISLGVKKYYSDPKNRLKKSKATKKQFEKLRKNKKKHLAWRMKKRANAAHYKPYYTSKIEVKIEFFLKQLNIDYIHNKPITNIIHRYPCDFYLPKHNLIIECDGDYWHNYPDLRELDLKRNIELKQAGYKLLRIWEREIKVINIIDFKNKLKGVLND
jgi:very-short-patch-repair endonuclease